MAGLTIDRKAWDAGFAAGEAGKALTACPYPKGSNESLFWHSGFIEGKAKRGTTQLTVAVCGPKARRTIPLALLPAPCDITF